MPIFCSKGARLFPAANPLCAQGMAVKGLPQNRANAPSCAAYMRCLSGDSPRAIG